MPIKFIPEDRKEWLELRALDVTSTESAALFDASPYTTEFELWHKKKAATIDDFDPTERMAWGTRLQDVIAAGIAEDQGWTVRKLNAYIRHDDLTARMGSSFDFEIISHADGPGILEIKNVDWLVFRDQWLKDGKEIEAPEHIEIQLQHQLEVIGRSWGAIGVLVGGNQMHVLRRERDREIGTLIRNRCTQFWQSIDAGVAPDPNFKADAAFITRLYNHAEPNKIFDARGDVILATLCDEYTKLGNQIKNLTEDRDAIKAHLLTKIGDAEKVITDIGTISAGVVAPTQISYTREGYRSFRFNKKRVAA